MPPNKAFERSVTRGNNCAASVETLSLAAPETRHQPAAQARRYEAREHAVP
jgi:hypothetical protein